MTNSPRRRSPIACWIEAMRLRTLPVSLSGVLFAIGMALSSNCFKPVAAALCLIFALLAQIASNFANEYYDYRDGLDAPGREGPRRGVTEGDITPRAMLLATYLTLGLACCVGLGLLFFGGWWLLPAGLFIAVGAMAYSAGPYPLSRHGLGEVTVVLFFGLVPVTLTYYVQALDITIGSILAGLGVGLMAANILIINNYRDAEADSAVGKRTLCVIIGSHAYRRLYIVNSLIGMALTAPQWMPMPKVSLAIPLIYAVGSLAVWLKMPRLSGHRLTPALAATALLMLLYCGGYLLCVAATK